MFDGLLVGPQWVLRAADIRAIAAAYGLHLTAAVARPLGGAVNGVSWVATTGGAVVFRVHRPWTTPDRLTAVHHASHQLRAAGCPLPEVLRTRAGATWIWIEDRLAEVGEYVANDGPVDTWERGEAAFATLARLHAALDDLDPRAVSPAPYSSYADPDTALLMLAETEQAFAALRGERGYAAAAVARRETQALLRDLAIERQCYGPTLARGLTHGDYGGDNVLIRDDRVAAILDFDFLDERERIYDLAHALYWMLDRFGVAVDGAPFAESALLKAARLLRRYQLVASRPLSTAELRALPFEMARIPLYPLVEAGYIATTDAPRAPIDRSWRFARHLPLAQALAGDADHVHDVLSRA